MRQFGGAVRAVLLTAMVAAPLGAAAAEAEPKPDEMVNNPPHAYWSGFHPGTTVTQKETVTLADGTKIETTAVSKLVEANKQQVVVETRMPAEGEASETVTDVYAATVKMSEVDSPASAAKVTEGKEEVEVKGKKVEAEWVESTIEDGDDTWIEKVWTARDVPGGIVKETLVHKQGNAVQSTSVTELVDFKVVS